MDLYHKWNVKNDFAFLLQFFSLISNSSGGVERNAADTSPQFFKGLKTIFHYQSTYFNISEMGAQKYIQNFYL